MNDKDLINFQGYSVEKFSMEKNCKIPSEKKDTIDIKYDSYINKEKKNNYRVLFSINLFTKTSKIYVEFAGLFFISDKLNDEEKKYVLNVTAATILYPYVRTFISNVTSFDTGDAVILPVLNFAERYNIL